MNKNLSLLIAIAMLVAGGIAGYFIGTHHSKNAVGTEGNEHSFTKDDYSERSLSNEEIDFVRKVNAANSFKLAGSSGPIDPVKAKTMITDYQNENKDPATTGPLMNENSELLRGFFIENSALKNIVNDAGNYGVSFYFAKKGGSGSKHIYTLVYMGAKAANNFDPLKPVTATNTPWPITNPQFDASSNGLIYDFINPCPDACGTGN